MAEIINGLQIDIKAAELKEMLLGRLKYHEARVEVYQKQHEQLSKVERVLSEEAEAIGKVSNTSPVESVLSALKKHKDQAIYYRFMHDHVVEGAVYRLPEADLVRLGIKSERHY